LLTIAVKLIGRMESNKMDYKDVPIFDDVVFEDIKTSLGDKTPLMIQYFLEDTDIFMSQFKKAYDDSDFNKIIDITHSIKSSSRQIGAVRLGEISERIEKQCKASQIGGIRNIVLLEDMINDMYKVIPLTIEKLKEKQ